MSTWGGSIYSATCVRLDFAAWKDSYSNRYSSGGTRVDPTRVDPLPMLSRTYGRPHTSLINDPTTSSSREDVRTDVRMRVAHISNTLQTVTRCEGDCNTNPRTDEGLAARRRGMRDIFDE